MTSAFRPVLMTKVFARFARKAGLERTALIEAADAIAAGRFDADLGGGVFKQRIARPGGGKSGGYRSILLFRVGGRSVFAHGFAKSEKANVTEPELKALKALARLLLALPDGDIAKAVAAGELIEVNRDGGEADEV